MIPISEAESTALLEKSGPLGQYVPLSFGPGGVALDTEDAGARWAVETLQAMRTAERELATELNQAVDTAVTDTLRQGLTEAFVGQAPALVDRVTNDLGYKITTAVFEAMQAAGFTIVRKVG